MNNSSSYLVVVGLCTELHDVADPDVAGWGVITAFTAAIILNITAILVGYLFGGLPRDRYHSLDRQFLATLGLPSLSTSSTCIALKDLSQTSSPSKGLPNSESRDRPPSTSTAGESSDTTKEQPDVQPADSTSPTDIITRERWFRVLKPFVLGMSDQQLFTGMALMAATMFMIGGLQGLNETLSVYSFRVVTSLAYFSCIIHLCSLTVVRDHFDEHRRLGYFRAGLIVLFLGLLIVCMVISESVTFRFNSNVSVKCALQHFRLVDPRRPNYVNVSDEIIITFNLAVLICIILIGYYRRLRELFDKDSRYIVTGGTPSSLLDAFQASFLSEAVWMLFYFAFGLANLFKFLIDENANSLNIKPSFGQLVPIFLLAQPFLAAFAALSESRPTNGSANRTSNIPLNLEPQGERSWPMVLGVFLYISSLLVWALMFANIIPGAFILSLVACISKAGFIVFRVYRKLAEGEKRSNAMGN
ncbi:hypothetical protein BGZ61DRAFT_384964 [Ilyonectria robusta]|uniref:uncharacterized protein n=1 Tax=Ilyonectria robusta TaxID=1079257 RepID=UPI001E8D59E6|nr:uncharacterized protein BGZ61DRAFT_384964 [Ilyonectria robusta]KAH8729246.1 hypothetical protein BGZ61DRAFT_384964 [Ilyonectria robusta]